MRITKLYIKRYKNLEELNWEINPNYAITAIVGKNASGKSNLLAAIMEIFGQCYSYTQKKKVNSSKFEFSITYTTQYCFLLIMAVKNV